MCTQATVCLPGLTMTQSVGVTTLQDIDTAAQSTDEFKCRYCLETFKELSDFKVHSALHTPTCNRPFQCPHCHKSFKQQGHRDTHMRSHTNERPYECQDCWMAFKMSPAI